MPNKIATTETLKHILPVYEDYILNKSNQAALAEMEKFIAAKQPPIYRIDESNPNRIQLYINIRDLVNGETYFFNSATQKPKTEATSWMLHYIVVCDDGSEFPIASKSGTIDYALGEFFEVVTNEASEYAMYVGWIDFFNSEFSLKYIVKGNDTKTAASLTKETQYNSRFLSTQNYTPYTPTKEYHPTTKKYVDDAIAALESRINAIINSGS